MSHDFIDHPRKKVVREVWDTPVIKRLHSIWGSKYLYFGLPGPKALDVELWKDMIRRVIAFELEATEGDSRRNITALTRKLELIGIPGTVYCGQMEEAILWWEDYDGDKLVIDDFITLFNLDFCGPITERIVTYDGTKECLRFEALREIPSIQRNLYRTTGHKKSIMLVTVRDSFHISTMQSFISDPDLPSEMSEYIQTVLEHNPLGTEIMGRNVELLKMFIFKYLRDWFKAHNISSVFLPVISYQGTSEGTQMMHFAIICEMGPKETPGVVDQQSTKNFLDIRTLSVDGTRIIESSESNPDSETVNDPCELLTRYCGG